MISTEEGFLSSHKSCAPLEGETKEMPRARRVFHALLVRRLEMDGAMSASKLRGRLYWFKLTFTDQEVDEVVASASGHGVIEPMEEIRPSGQAGPPQMLWIATDRGRALPFPSGASFEDLSYHAPSVLSKIRDSLTVWSGIAVALLAAAGVGAAITADKTLAVALAIYAFATLLCLAGISAERDLEAAAKAWPRFRQRYPLRYQWQTLPGRAELISAGALMALALVLGGWVAIPAEPAAFALALAGAAVALVTLGIYVVRLRPLAEAWRQEAGVRSRSAQRKRRLGKKIGGAGKLSWVLKSPRSGDS